jgi:pilus assembly protein Flp/PilA
MQPLVKAPIGFDAPLSTDLNAVNSANDPSLEQAICGVNGFEGEDKDLDYILDYKGKGMRLIPLSLVRQNVVLRSEQAVARGGDGSSRSQGAVAYPPMPRESPLSRPEPEWKRTIGARLMTNFCSRFVKDDSGATAIEYGLIAALISVAAIVAFTTVRDNLSAVFGYVAGQLNT